MSNLFYQKRYCQTKAQEEIITPLLPSAKATGRPSLDHLKVFNASLWIMSSGAEWRDLPAHYGNWNSIYHKFRQWSATVAGARKISGNQEIGVSRGGKTTKIHALVTENFQFIGLLLTSGNVVRLIFAILSIHEKQRFVFPTKPTRK